MSELDNDLAEDIEEFDALDSVADVDARVSRITNELDIAVAAWHEDGRWTLGVLPDPTDIAQIITSLKSQQTNGGAIALISIDEEFFILIKIAIDLRRARVLFQRQRHRDAIIRPLSELMRQHDCIPFFRAALSSIHIATPCIPR